MGGSGDIHVAGTGSFALEVAEYARNAGLEVAGLIELQDPARVGTEVHGLPCARRTTLPWARSPWWARAATGSPTGRC